MERESRLVKLCIETACESRESVEKWRKQRRTMERMPSSLADALLHRLLHHRLLFPSLLEVFKHSAEVIDLRGENAVDAEWMAYLGAFRCLRSLNLADCYKLNSSALWPLTGMGGLKEVDLSRCLKVTDTGIRHLLSISTLEILRISETGVSANGVALLSSLRSLSVLDLGGLPVTDEALISLQALSKLEYLDLWGSEISNNGAAVFQLFAKLSFLNLAWTSVTKLPNILSLQCLNMSNCNINSVFQGDGSKAALMKLIFSGATFVNEAEAFLYMETNDLSFLDVSGSSLHGFCFLLHMKQLQHLDLSSSMAGDDSLELVACVGANLRHLNLSKTKVTSAGLAILAENAPKLETLSLSHTSISDLAISYISMMPSLKSVDLSNTCIEGFILQVDAESSLMPSLTDLGCLNHLVDLNLENTRVKDASLDPLSGFQKLSHLCLRSIFLTDASLHLLSSLSKLTHLGFFDAVLTDNGLLSFRPPASLKLLDLRGCWLLTKDAILLFCRRHPQTKVRHEHLEECSTEQKASLHSSPSGMSLRTSQVKCVHKNMPTSWPVSRHFVDQRLKYGREELLALQFSSSSLGLSSQGPLNQ